MEPGVLWGYAPGETITEEAGWSYGASLPLLVEFLLDEFIPSHVDQRRRRAATEDLLVRLDELIGEARFCHARAIPITVGPWYLAKRDHALKRSPSDLRKRRARSREQPVRLVQYEELCQRLRPYLPRRRAHESVSADQFEELKRAFPELSWTKRSQSIGETPATVARLILSQRSGLTRKGVEKAVRRSRRELRQKATPSSK